MVQNLNREKSYRVPLLKTHYACINQSDMYAVSNLKLTSSRILSLPSPNSYTSNSNIAGAMTPRMLSKRTPHTIHVKTSFSNHTAARWTG